MQNIMKTKILLLAILMTFMASCVTKRKCTLKFPQVASRDSIYIETVNEMPIYLPGDSILVDVPIDCPDQELVNVETGKLKQQISILNGRLITRTNIKPDTVFVRIKETVTKIKEVKVPEKVKFVPKIVKIFAWIGVLCIISLLIYLFIKYKSLIFKLFR